MTPTVLQMMFCNKTNRVKTLLDNVIKCIKYLFKNREMSYQTLNKPLEKGLYNI